MPASQDDADVLILGAGFTGLAAAEALKERAPHLRVRLLEAGAEVGGRVRSFSFTRDGVTAAYDHGGQYVGDLQNDAMALIGRLGQTDPAIHLVNGPHKQRERFQEVMVVGDRRFSYDNRETFLGNPGVPPDISFWDGAGVFLAIEYVSWIERHVDVLHPHTSGLPHLDTLSVEAWLQQLQWLSRTSRDLIRISIKAVQSVEPTEVSPLSAFWYTACNDGLLHTVQDGPGGPQQYWPLCSMGHVVRTWAQEIDADIAFNQRVTHIDATGELVAVRTEDGSTYRAPKVICTLSPSQCAGLHTTPALDPHRQLLFRQAAGRTTKCQLVYDTPWWRDQDGYAHNGYAGGVNDVVLWVMDNSYETPEGTLYCLMVFVVAGRADEHRATSDTQLIELITKRMAYLFNDKRARYDEGHLRDSEVFRWNPEDGIAAGGPKAILGPGVISKGITELFDAPWQDRVLFKCTDTSRNPCPTTACTRWSDDHPEHLPAYDAQNLRTNSGPFRSKYSDHRKSTGYIDGALHAGRWSASWVLGEVGPTPPRPAPEPLQDPYARALMSPLPILTMVGVATALELGIRVIIARTEAQVGDDPSHMSEHADDATEAFHLLACAAATHTQDPEWIQPHLEDDQAQSGGPLTRVRHHLEHELQSTNPSVAVTFVPALQRLIYSGLHWSEHTGDGLTIPQRAALSLFRSRDAAISEQMQRLNRILSRRPTTEGAAIAERTSPRPTRIGWMVANF